MSEKAMAQLVWEAQKKLTGLRLRIKTEKVPQNVQVCKSEKERIKNNLAKSI